MSERTEVHVSEIVDSRWQKRQNGYSGPSFDELVASVREHGIINPPGVLINDNDEYELIWGHRRLAAARAAGITTVPVTVKFNLLQGNRQKILDQVQQMVIADNLHHENLTPVELAESLQELIEQQGLTQQQVAAAFGKSQQWVSDKLRLLDLAPEVEKALTERAVEESTARKLAQLPEDEQAEMLERVKGKTTREAAEIIEGPAGEPPFRKESLADEKVQEAMREAEEQAKEEYLLNREIQRQDQARIFYQQQTQGTVSQRHWLSRGCHRCAHFAGAEAQDLCKAKGMSYFEASFWEGDGVTVPQCGDFLLRDIQMVPEIDQSAFDDILLAWLDHNIAALWYMIPGEETEEMRRALREAELNRKQLAALVGYAVSEFLWSWAEEATVVNPITGGKTAWTKVKAPETAG